MLCQDNKPYIRVNKDNNYSKFDKATFGTRVGFTEFTAYRITFDDENRMFMQTNDFTFSESSVITFADGSTSNNDVNAGEAGDCYAGFNNGGNVARGSFSLDLTGTGLAFHELVEWISFEDRHGMVSCFQKQNK